MRISDWSSDVCSSDLLKAYAELPAVPERRRLATRSHGRWAGRLWRRLRPNTPRITIAEPASVELQRLRRALGAASTAEPSDLCIVAAGSLRGRSEEHTSELQSLMRISYAVFCLKKKKTHTNRQSIVQ